MNYRLARLFLLILCAALLITACGRGELTDEKYQDVIRALEEARASGDPEDDVYERFNVTPEEIRRFESERTREELAELRGLETDMGFIIEGSTELSMTEEDYIEIFIYIGGLQSRGLTPEKVDEGLLEKLSGMGYDRFDLEYFSDYVQNTPDVKKRVDAEIERRIAAGEQVLLVEEPLDR